MNLQRSSLSFLSAGVVDMCHSWLHFTFTAGVWELCATDRDRKAPTHTEQARAIPREHGIINIETRGKVGTRQPKARGPEATGGILSPQYKNHIFSLEEPLP